MAESMDESERAAALEYFRETFGLTEDNIEEYADIATSYAVYRGLMKRTEDMKYLPIQFCLTPSWFPTGIFEFINEMQFSMNRLIHDVAESDGFLAACFEHDENLDDFNSRLWNIQKIIQKEGITPKFHLRIMRCDYMLHGDNLTDVGVKLVENNTMAVAMASLSPIAKDMYEHLFHRLGKKELSSRLPSNDSAFGLALGLQTAWQHYSRYVNENCVILFVVEGHDMSNICDHRALEFDTWKRQKNIKVIRHTFEELRTTASLVNRKLFVGKLEVAVVYYRWGYMPQHYTDEDWELRLMIERSAAIKIPTVAYQLAGTKKVQQALSIPSALRSFGSPKIDPAKIQQLFVPQHILDPSNKNSTAVQLVLKNPDKYVLKPDREGGGNNIFGEDIVKFINSYEKKESSELYILMEKINAPPCPNYVVQPGCSPRLTNVVMEIGMYGFAIATSANSWESSVMGYVVKSKEYGMNEGGLCSGLSFLDAPFLS